MINDSYAKFKTICEAKELFSKLKSLETTCMACTLWDEIVERFHLICKTL